MPFQGEIARRLAGNRSPESHLAWGGALHFADDTPRATNDLDYFHDSEEAVARAFEADAVTLKEFGCGLALKINRPGFVRAVVSRGKEATKVDWAADSAWRFFPAVPHPELGYVLHPLDLAVNKVLALVGRDEPRDYLDVLYVHKKHLSLGALCWAAAGKDPGLSPALILDLMARKNHYRAEQFQAVATMGRPDLPALKREWLDALAGARALVEQLPAGEAGCLYYNPESGRFVTPGADTSGLKRHHGRPGGCIPEVGERALISGDAGALKYLDRPLPDAGKGRGTARGAAR
ncbi:MAG: hypothetical protein LBC18_13345 [Opitutaceae bacterium]|nr:hypothetical protein [Opitutaceae bacterium]